MTTKINNEHNKLNFSSEREQSQACLNSAEHEKNQGRKVLNVPILRFPEFQGEWEKCILGDITENFNLRNKDKIQYPMFSVTNDRGFIPQSEQFEGRDMVGEDIKAYKIIHSNDFAYNPARINVGSIAMYTGEKPCMISSLYVCFKTTKKVNNEWLMQLLKTPKMNYYYNVNGEGGVRVYLFYPNFARIRMFIPKIEEQKKIAKLLNLIDERIATQNKIIDKLQSLIKGIGKQLFMDNQNWRTVKIGELLRIGNGKDYKHLSIGKIPVYGTGGQMLLVNDYLYDGESVCIGRKGTIDTPMFLKGKFWTVDTLFYTYDFKDVLPKFCYYLFLQINWKLYNEGTGVPSLSKSTIENIKVKIPSLEQQQKICSILDCYEHKTNNEEQILELYHSEKQYLLRQMFI